MRTKLRSFLALVAIILLCTMQAHAQVASIDGTTIHVFQSNGTVSSDMTCTQFAVSMNSTLTINKGVTVTLNNPETFDLFMDSKIELHGTLAGNAGSRVTWVVNSYINVYLSDGAKYTVTGLSCVDGDNYLVYYGYDAATDGNGTVSVKNGSTDVTSTSTGYKTTTYTFTATPSDGYKFVNWTKGAGGEVLGTDASINVTCEQNGQYQVYANFEEDAPAATLYNLTLADGTEDAANWTISPAAAEAGETVTLTYAGTKTVKSIKVVKKEAAAATARPLAEATAEDLGKIVGADGNIYDTKDAAEAAGTTAVAMIAYVGSDTGHATYKQGLAIALADEITADEITADEINQFDWSTAKSTCEGKTAIDGNSWKLPSQDEWKNMFKAFGGSEESHTGLNTAITTAGGTALVEGRAYWSSSEVDETNAWDVFPNYYGHADWTETPKSIAYRVRACLAFGEEAAPATARTLAEATAEDLGKIVGGDGNIYDTKDAAEAAGTTAVAMIAYLPGSPEQATYTPGLAIALDDESYSNWSTANSTCAGKSAVANAVWMLPSMYQWKTMFKAFGGSEGSSTGLNTAITNAGGTAVDDEDATYWSSSEEDEDNAWIMRLYEGGVSWSDISKSTLNNVRACLAFEVEVAPVATAPTLAEATAEDLGKIVGADGNIYDTKDAAETAGTTAVAMIAYVGSSTEHDTYTHGLAIALAHETDSNWSTAKSNCEGKSAVANAAWMLPSQDQWKAMFKAFGDNEDSYTGLQTAITTAGGEALGEDENYWTSSEVNETKALKMYLDLEGVAEWANSAMSITRNVRACLTF